MFIFFFYYIYTYILYKCAIEKNAHNLNVASFLKLLLHCTKLMHILEQVLRRDYIDAIKLLVKLTQHCKNLALRTDEIYLKCDSS